MVGSERGGLGFEVRSTHSGISLEPFESAGDDMGGRIGLLAVKP